MPRSSKRPETVAPTVAVVASDSTVSLLEQRFTVIRLDGVEELLGLEQRLTERRAGDPSVAVFEPLEASSGPAESIESLARHFGRIRLVLVARTIQRWEVRAALLAGAAGLVLSEDRDSALVPSIEAVRAGQTCVPRANSRQIEPPALSAREKQILGLVVMGYMNSQIAERLFLAESTVKSHLSSVFSKLGVRSRNDAVSLILDPERGLGTGILAIGGEPLESLASTA